MGRGGPYLASLAAPGPAPGHTAGASHRTARVAPRHPQLANGGDAPVPMRSAPTSAPSSLDEPHSLGASSSHSPDPTAGGGQTWAQTRILPLAFKGARQGRRSRRGAGDQWRPSLSGLVYPWQPSRAYTLPCLSGVRKSSRHPWRTPTRCLQRHTRGRQYQQYSSTEQQCLLRERGPQRGWRGPGRTPDWAYPEMPVSVSVSPGGVRPAVFPRVRPRVHARGGARQRRAHGGTGTGTGTLRRGGEDRAPSPGVQGDSRAQGKVGWGWLTRSLRTG